MTAAVVQIGDWRLEDWRTGEVLTKLAKGKYLANMWWLVSVNPNWPLLAPFGVGCQDQDLNEIFDFDFDFDISTVNNKTMLLW